MESSLVDQHCYSSLPKQVESSTHVGKKLSEDLEAVTRPVLSLCKTKLVEKFSFVTRSSHEFVHVFKSNVNEKLVHIFYF